MLKLPLGPVHAIVLQLQMCFRAGLNWAPTTNSRRGMDGWMVAGQGNNFSLTSSVMANHNACIELKSSMLHIMQYLHSSIGNQEYAW